MEKFKIDDVATACGLTKRTIRYYEELNLLFPPERSEGGTRLYTHKHIERLNLIKNARDVLGISLMEISEYVSIREKMGEHREVYSKAEEAEHKQQQLRRIKELISQQLSMVDQKLARMVEFRKELESIAKRVDDGLTITST